MIPMTISTTRCGHTHCYRKKTGKQFLDFIKRIVDQKYDSNGTGYVSIHKSNNVKETIARYHHHHHPRIP